MPDENNWTVSRLNVENVLSPPSKPVLKNSLKRGEIKPACVSSPIMKPISSPAIKFESKVPSGKTIPVFLQVMVSRYRRHEPKNPPTPTYKYAMIIAS